MYIHSIYTVHIQATLFRYLCTRHHPLPRPSRWDSLNGGKRVQSTHLPPRRGPAFGAYSPATARMCLRGGEDGMLVESRPYVEVVRYIAHCRRGARQSGTLAGAPYTDLICDCVGFDLQLLQLGFGRRSAILDRRLCRRHSVNERQKINTFRALWTRLFMQFVKWCI